MGKSAWIYGKTAWIIAKSVQIMTKSKCRYGKGHRFYTSELLYCSQVMEEQSNNWICNTMSNKALAFLTDRFFFINAASKWLFIWKTTSLIFLSDLEPWDCFQKLINLNIKAWIWAKIIITPILENLPPRFCCPTILQNFREIIFVNCWYYLKSRPNQNIEHWMHLCVPSYTRK